MNTIIPKVEKIKNIDGSFTLNEKSCIVCDELTMDLGALLSDYLATATGFSLKVVNTSATSSDIQLSVNGDNKADEQGFFNEEYSLNVNSLGVNIIGASVAGVARGIQSLRQLFPVEIFSTELISNIKWSIDSVEIFDKPKFRWRGMHLDVARHFLNVKEVCRLIDLFAMHRINILHWHLTEDQGWRIEIKKYPKLTEIGSIRKCTMVGHYSQSPKQFDNEPYGGFYTQEDIKEVVQYAARRHVIIVPEIDMPGHMQAAIAAYPELGNNPNAKLDLRPIWGISRNILNVEESTIKFMQDVLSEVIDLFPSKYIHVGGDEALKTEWEESRKAQDKMAELGLKSEDELQSWFIGRMNELISSKGRTLIGWDEIAEGGLVKDVAVMCWRGIEIAYEVAQKKQYLVNADNKQTYFDYYQADPKKSGVAIGGDLPTEKVYRFNPIPPNLPEEDEKYILGGQGQLWTEYMKNIERVEEMAFPRVCALSEKLWNSEDNCLYSDFLSRLKIHRERLNLLKVNAHPLP